MKNRKTNQKKYETSKNQITKNPKPENPKFKNLLPPLTLLNSKDQEELIKTLEILKEKKLLINYEITKYVGIARLKYE